MERAMMTVAAIANAACMERITRSLRKKHNSELLASDIRSDAAPPARVKVVVLSLLK